MRIAIIGTGVAGLGAAHRLHLEHDLVVYEAGSHVGGHANTVEVAGPSGSIAVDTGFIVYNERNYPLLTGLFDELDVPTQPSDMSFSVSVGDGAFEYEGSAKGLFAQRSNLLSPAHLRMGADILRFSREARALLAAGHGGPADAPLGAFVRERGFSRAFVDRYLVPMAGAVWSATPEDVLAFPAGRIAAFMDNHGLLDLRGRPQWRTVAGGSREYVRRVSAGFRRSIRLGTAVREVRRGPGGVRVADARGRVERFDGVVFASHPDETLAMLGPDATRDERRILGAFTYRENFAVLHGDAGLMPRRRSVWASWNSMSPAAPAPGDERRPAAVTYWMNRLQNLDPAVPLFLSLNPLREPRADAVLGEFAYAHPQFDGAAVAAQAALPRIQGADRAWFAGAWCGHGFHEDGLRSGFEAAGALLASERVRLRVASADVA